MIVRSQDYFTTQIYFKAVKSSLIQLSFMYNTGRFEKMKGLLRKFRNVSKNRPRFDTFLPVFSCVRTEKQIQTHKHILFFTFILITVRLDYTFK